MFRCHVADRAPQTIALIGAFGSFAASTQMLADVRSGSWLCENSPDRACCMAISASWAISREFRLLRVFPLAGVRLGGCQPASTVALKQTRATTPSSPPGAVEHR